MNSMTKRCPTCKRSLDVKEFGVTTIEGKFHPVHHECRISRNFNVKAYFTRYSRPRETAED